MHTNYAVVGCKNECRNENLLVFCAHIKTYKHIRTRTYSEFRRAVISLVRELGHAPLPVVLHRRCFLHLGRLTFYLLSLTRAHIHTTSTHICIHMHEPLLLVALPHLICTFVCVSYSCVCTHAHFGA